MCEHVCSVFGVIWNQWFFLLLLLLDAVVALGIVKVVSRLCLSMPEKVQLSHMQRKKNISAFFLFKPPL